MNDKEIESLEKKLEELGEEGVQKNLAQGVYRPEKKRVVERWLTKKETEKTVIDEEKKFDLASKANQIAHSNNIVAGLALIVSIISLVVVIFFK